MYMPSLVIALPCLVLQLQLHYSILVFSSLRSHRSCLDQERHSAEEDTHEDGESDALFGRCTGEEIWSASCGGRSGTSTCDASGGSSSSRARRTLRVGRGRGSDQSRCKRHQSDGWNGRSTGARSSFGRIVGGDEDDLRHRDNRGDGVAIDCPRVGDHGDWASGGLGNRRSRTTAVAIGGRLRDNGIII